MIGNMLLIYTIGGPLALLQWLGELSDESMLILYYITTNASFHPNTPDERRFIQVLRYRYN